MCFSATASFVASATLGTIGAVTLTQVKEKKELPLALVPVFFAIQQLLEGFVWLSLPDSPYLLWFSYGFLFFAFILWPTYLPFVERCLQKIKGRIEIQDFLLGMGFMLSLYLALMLLATKPEVEVVGNCIRYGVNVPYEKIGMGIYLVVTAGSLFLSKLRVLQVFALLLTISFFVSAWFYEYTFTSVWCFFAAALSLILLLYFRRKAKK